VPNFTLVLIDKNASSLQNSGKYLDLTGKWRAGIHEASGGHFPHGVCRSRILAYWLSLSFLWCWKIHQIRNTHAE